MTRSPEEILAELAAQPRAAADRLREEGEASALVEALRRAKSERARTILCDLLGFRHEQSAIGDLVGCLEDESPDVRASAADALAKIGDPRAGAAMLRRFLAQDPSVDVQQTLAAALGAVGCKEAIPALIRWLGNPNPSQRGGAAASLGALGATEALEVLRAAVRRERIRYPRQRMREAIRAIQKASGETA